MRFLRCIRQLALTKLLRRIPCVHGFVHTLLIDIDIHEWPARNNLTANPLGIEIEMPWRFGSSIINAMIDDIERATDRSHMRRVMVDEAARRLRLNDAAVDAAIPQADRKGLLVSAGKPPHRSA